MSYRNLILTDVDGVLISWEWAFQIYMQEKGYKVNNSHKSSYALNEWYDDLDSEDAKSLIKTFNESAAIGFLPALRDSVFYVKRLYEEHGIQFRCITSLSLNKNAGKLREMNLIKLFGNAIESVICLDTGADKDEALLPYKDTGMYWIEDKIENANTGYKLGLKSILMEHGHNMHYRPPYPVVKNWKEIYSLIVGKNE